jgi:cytochrome c oxidase subunit II
MKRLARRLSGLVLGSLLFAGCSPLPKALRPAGTGADWISELFWLFTAVCAAVWVAVTIALLFALFGRRKAAEKMPTQETWASRIVVAAVAVTVITLLGLTIASYFTDRSLANLGDERSLTIKVTARQWWWEVEYVHSEPSRTLTTANEIHVPTSVPIILKLASSDVIHSFWVPELAGKMDLVPGRENILRIRAERSGRYSGQCSEFCGLQHAHMRLLIIAKDSNEFAQWYEKQLQPARQPQSAEARLGREIFLQRPCVMCHTISGTPAASRAGPDLSHVASRQTLAAGTLPLTRGSLAAWIADPQTIKPGAKMPLTHLGADELNAVVAYLESLQ